MNISFVNRNLIKFSLRKMLFSAAMMFSFMVVIPEYSLAAFNLSVMPLNGGNSIRLGRVGYSIASGEEVKIRISSSDEKQYQVYQRLVEPLINEQGEILAAGAIMATSLIGSNASGTLYLQQVEPFSFADQLVYTSGVNGESDSFTLVYSVNPERIRNAGNFAGKIQYAIRPIGESSQESVIVSMFLEASGRLKFHVEGSGGGNRVRLRSTDHNRVQDGDVAISFEGNLGEIRVFQELEGFIQNELLEPLDDGLVQFRTLGAMHGELFMQSEESLSAKRVLLYKSSAGEDAFVSRFELNPQVLKQHKAGIYRGRMNYIIESHDTLEEIPFEFEVEISPLFQISVDLPVEGLRFAKLMPMSEPQLSEVLVRVQTNLGQPFMVMQKVASPLTNAKGEVFTREHFHLKVESVGDYRGKIPYQDYHPVDDGESILYISDGQGSPVKFKVTYRLSPYVGMAPGDYTTRIVYSLGEK